VNLDPTAAAFLSSLDGDSALEALREARIAGKAFGWSEDTQRAVTDGVMRHFGARKAARLAARQVAS
jgi:hypothetical protein